MKRCCVGPVGKIGFVPLPVLVIPPRHLRDVSCYLRGDVGRAAAAAVAVSVVLTVQVPCWADVSLVPPEGGGVQSTVTSSFVKTTIPGSAKEAKEMSKRNSRVTGDAARIFTAAKRAAEVGNLDEATARYSELVTIAPTFAGGYSNRANLEVTAGKYNESIEDYTKAIELAPLSSDTWVVYLNRGSVLQKTGRVDDALQDFNRALDLKPDEPLVLSNRAAVFASKQKWELAVSDYRKAIEKKPNDVEPYWLNYSLTLFQKGLKTESISILKRVLARYPEEPIVRAAYAVFLFDRGELAEAESIWTMIDRPRPLQSRQYLEDHQWPPKAIEAMVRFKTLRD